MRVLVCDAGCPAGRAVVTAALDAGHEVTAVLRGGARPLPPQQRLDVLIGSPDDRSVLDKAVLNCDAVVSVAAVTDRRPTTRFSDAVATLVEALDQAGAPDRVVCVSSSRVDTHGPGLSPLRRGYLTLIIHRRHHNAINDQQRMEAELTRTALSWTLLRPPPLVEGPVTGVYRTAAVGHVPGGGSSLSTGDLGHAVARCLADPATSRSTLHLAY